MGFFEACRSLLPFGLRHASDPDSSVLHAPGDWTNPAPVVYSLSGPRFVADHAARSFSNTPVFNMYDKVRRMGTQLLDQAKCLLDTVTPNDPVCNPFRILTSVDQNAVLLDLPDYRQAKTYTCGLVAGLVVLHYFYPKRSSEAFRKRVAPTRDDGVSSRRLVMALRNSGIQVGIRRAMGFEDIAAAIDAGKPVIVTVARSETEDHWIVVGGYARQPKRVFVWNESWLRCPACFGWREFKAKWEPKGLGFVCARKSTR